MTRLFFSSSKNVAKKKKKKKKTGTFQRKKMWHKKPALFSIFRSNHEWVNKK